MSEPVEFEAALLGPCPFCHVEVSAADARQACATCAAWHHASCWSEEGGCTRCGVPEAPLPREGERCAVAACGRRPLPDQSRAPWAGRCLVHAREHGLFLAGLMTVGLVVFAVPGVLLVLSEVPEAGALLLGVAGVFAAGRAYYARRTARLAG